MNVFKRLRVLAVLAGILAVGSVGGLLAQGVFVFVSQITGNEVVQNQAVGTAQYFKTSQILNAIAYATSHGATSPTLSSCGTTPLVTGTDIAGTVEFGTSASTCLITFGTPYVTKPVCSVDWQNVTNAVTPSYVITPLAIIASQTSTTNNLMNYICLPQQGG